MQGDRGAPVTAQAGWFRLNRFGLRTRDNYAAMFEKVEAVIATYCGTVRSVIASADGDLTEQGVFKRLITPRTDTLRSAEAQLEAIGAAAQADSAAIDAILTAPAMPASAEYLSERAYQQALVLRQLDDPRFDVLAQLEQAIQVGDVPRAEVLADLGPTEVMRSGVDVAKARRLANGQNAALKLRADPDRRAAFALQEALEGADNADSFGRVGGVLAKLDFARYSVGGRLELIDENNGDDQLVRTYSLDFPQPATWSSNGFYLDPPSLKRILQNWYGIGSTTGTRS